MAATAGTTAATGWEGVGGVAMVATAMPYVAALEALSGWVQQSAASAAAIEQAYVTAKAAMIQVPICTTNRTTQAGLVATNIIGRTPRDHRPRHRILRPLLDAKREQHGRLRSHRDAHHRRARHSATARAAHREPCGLRPAQAAAIGQAAANGAASAAMTQACPASKALRRRPIGHRPRRRAPRSRWARQPRRCWASSASCRRCSDNFLRCSASSHRCWANSHRWRWACWDRCPAV